jgi:hypothetical protein
MATITYTKDQIAAACRSVQAIAEAIRELKQVPSGHLYARVMAYISINQYEKFISILESGKLIRRDPSGLLTWIGPELEDEESEIAGNEEIERLNNI